MEVSQVDRVRLGFDADRRQLVLANLMSGEIADIPGGDQGVCSLTFENGAALVQRERAEALWADDIFELQVVTSPEGELFLLDHNENLEPLHKKLYEHSQHVLSITVARRSQAIRVFVYAVPWSGCRLWWSFKGVWQALQLGTPTSEQQFRETWRPWRVKMMELMSWSCPPHLRRAIPARASTAKEDRFLDLIQTRHLEEASMSTPALLCVVVRCSSVKPSKATAQHKKKNEVPWQALLDSFATIFWESAKAFKVKVFLDPSVVCDLVLPVFGSDACELAVSGGGGGELAALKGTNMHGARLHKVLQEQERVAVGELLHLVYYAGKTFRWAFKQFVRAFAMVIDTVLLAPGKNQASPMDLDPVLDLGSCARTHGGGLCLGGHSCSFEA